jgi:hypothetical protein
MRQFLSRTHADTAALFLGVPVCVAPSPLGVRLDLRLGGPPCGGELSGKCPSNESR